MDDRALHRTARRARLRYEWSRARAAVLGFAPAIALVIAAACLGTSPQWALILGTLTFVFGAVLLWAGREVKRAVLPSVLAGSVPAAFALCATHVGHACLGDRCTKFCAPACALGGVLAGAAVGIVGNRRGYGIAFWTSASVLTLLTGAMGCACVGMFGVAGLILGFVLGFAPITARRLLGSRSW